VANLPYIPTADIQGLSPEVSRFEPHHALDGGADGLGAITRLCSQAAQALDTNGWLLLEVGEGQADGVQQLLSQQHMWESLRSVPDLRGVSRVVAGRTVSSHR
jgi:release factor glutamine methyltransferase